MLFASSGSRPEWIADEAMAARLPANILLHPPLSGSAAFLAVSNRDHLWAARTVEPASARLRGEGGDRVPAVWKELPLGDGQIFAHVLRRNQGRFVEHARASVDVTFRSQKIDFFGGIIPVFRERSQCPAGSKT
jgi:hypothetical protein